MYRCPICRKSLYQKGNSYLCDHAHTFDIARSGYVNLYTKGRKISGDQKDMVEARTIFLSHGYYHPLRQGMIRLLKEIDPHVLIDAGCGQGYYTNAFQEALHACEIYGFDLSKYACKEAARSGKQVHYATASIASLPLKDACADALLSMFAPVYENEIRRVLKQNGCFIRVTPGEKHLLELKQVLYDHAYLNEPAKAIHGMNLEHTEEISYHADIQGQKDIQALFSMTPYAYRTSMEHKKRLTDLSSLCIQLQFHIEIWRK